MPGCHLPARQVPRRAGWKPRPIRALLDSYDSGDDPVPDGDYQPVSCTEGTRPLCVRLQAVERGCGVDLRVYW